MKIVMGLFAFLFLLAAPALAVDLDNNGISGDEIIPEPGVFEGSPDRDEVVHFPTSQDTWIVTYYPYWWNMGDTVFGNHTVPLSQVTHADIRLKIDVNVLSGSGHVDLDFRINGTTVGSIVVLPGHGTGYVEASFHFAPVAPPFELRYFETNTVVSGAGSVVLNETGLSTVTFRGDPTPVNESTWSRIKALYQ